MRGIAIAKLAKWRLIGCGVIVTGFFMPLMAMPVVAGDVHAIICRNPSTVTISSPGNDTILKNGTVSLAGVVSQASQLEVSIDGQYDSTIPVAYTSTTYSGSVRLTLGTHTIKVVSVDICQLGNADATVVVTYQPDILKQSEGVNVPTEIGNMPGVRVEGAAQSPAPASSPIPSVVVRPLQQLGEALDLAPTDMQSGLPPIVRFTLVSVGALTVMFSQTVSAAGATGRTLQFVASKIGMHNITGSRLLTILLGVIGVALAFLF